MLKKRIVVSALVVLLALTASACVVGGVPSYATYTVEHYLQNLENDEEGNKSYALKLSETQKCGVNDMTTANANEYEGYSVLPFKQIKITEEDTVVKIYYDRKSYAFSVGEAANGVLAEDTTASGDYLYGTEITVHAVPSDGYIFAKWAENAVSANPYTFLIDGETTLTPVYDKLTEKITIPNFAKQVYTYNGKKQSYTLGESIISGFAVSYKVPESEVWSESAPSVCGTYDILITRPEDEHFKAFSQLISNGFVLKKATYDMTKLAWNYTAPLQYNGYTQTVKVTGISASIKVEYTGNAKLEPGSYHATATFVFDTDNYVVPDVTSASLDWKIAKNEVVVPSAGFKYYNSSTLKSDLVSNTIYTVTTNNGGTEIGNYDVVLTLVHPEYSEWSNGSGLAEVTVSFEIRRINPDNIHITVTKPIDGGSAAATLVEDDISELGYHINFSILDADSVSTVKDGYAFVGWYMGEILLSKENSFDYEFSYSSLTINVTAQFRPLDKYMIKFFGTANAVISFAFVEHGAAIGAMPASPFISNYTFVGWFTGKYGTGTQATATFVPEADTDLYAFYELDDITYRVTVNNGTVNGNSVADVKAEAQVTLYCEAADFSYWMYDYNIISYDKSYKIYIRKDSEFTAVCGADTSSLVPSVILYNPASTVPTYDSANDRYVYDFKGIVLIGIPVGFTFKQAGTIASYKQCEITVDGVTETITRTVENFTLGHDSSMLTKSSTTKYNSYRLTVKGLNMDGFDVTKDTAFRPFLICSDSEGVEHTYYGDIYYIHIGE